MFRMETLPETPNNIINNNKTRNLTQTLILSGFISGGAFLPIFLPQDCRTHSMLQVDVVVDCLHVALLYQQ